jgi:hypothetical protein
MVGKAASVGGLFHCQARSASGSRPNALLIIAALAGGLFASRHQDLFSRQRRAHGTNQFISFDEKVMIVRLFSGKKTDGHKKRAEDQAYQHDFSVCTFVSVMK